MTLDIPKKGVFCNNVDEDDVAMADFFFLMITEIHALVLSSSSTSFVAVDAGTAMNNSKWTRHYQRVGVARTKCSNFEIFTISPYVKSVSSDAVRGDDQIETWLPPMPMSIYRSKS